MKGIWDSLGREEKQVRPFDGRELSLWTMVIGEE